MGGRNGQGGEERGAMRMYTGLPGDGREDGVADLADGGQWRQRWTTAETDSGSSEEAGEEQGKDKVGTPGWSPAVIVDGTRYRA